MDRFRVCLSECGAETPHNLDAAGLFIDRTAIKENFQWIKERNTA